MSKRLFKATDFQVSAKQREVAAETPLPAGGMEELRRHSRLQWHMRRFRDHPDQAGVLVRYRRLSASSGPKMLSRHLCHVAAWVALLPWESAERAVGNENLSPVHILTLLLSRCKCVPLTPWLRACLSLVADRLRALGALTGPWKDLHRAMPQLLLPRTSAVSCQSPEAVGGMLAAGPGGQGSSTAAIGNVAPPAVSQLHGARKASLLLHRSVVRWQSQTSLRDREAFIAALRAKFDNAVATGDAYALRAVLRGAVAALAMPIARRQASDAPRPLDEAARERLEMALQARLRELALACLKRLDCADRRSFPALDRLRHLIERFECCGVGVSEARAGEQWRRLKAAVAGEVEPVPVEGHGGDTAASAAAAQDEVAEKGPAVSKVKAWGQEELRELREVIETKLGACRGEQAAGGWAKLSWTDCKFIGQQLGRSTRSVYFFYKRLTDEGRAGGRPKQKAWGREELRQLRLAFEARIGISWAEMVGCAWTHVTKADYKHIAQTLGRGERSVITMCKRLTDPRFVIKPSPASNPRGIVRGMMLKAMEKLGGEATAREVIACCRSDADLQQEFGSRLSGHTTKTSHSSFVEAPTWEKSIINNMCNVFRATATKRNKQKVYSWR